MQHDSRGTSPLLPDRAFVVHFRTETAVQHEHYAGRVEHVVSGQAARFESLDELLGFIRQVLTTLSPPPSTGS